MVNRPEIVINIPEYESARKWFREVDEVLDALAIPFCSINIAKTKGLELYDYECLTHLRDLPANEKEGIVKYLHTLEESKPSPKIFVDLKNEIAKSAVSEIIDIYPDAHSAIVLGDPLGDIDIGLILEKEDNRKIFADKEYTGLLGKLRHNYPIIDVIALDYFRSNTGKELAEKLFSSHCSYYSEETGVYPLQESVLPHLNNAFENSWLLYGNNDDYCDFMSIYKEIVAPLRQIKNLKTVRDVSLPIYVTIKEVLSKFAGARV